MKLAKFMVAALVGAGVANASIIQVADYKLGEAGSVGATAPYTPLTDSIGGDNNIPSYNNWGTPAQSIVTSGLAAPGSTAALALSGNAGGGNTWYASSFNGGSGYTTDWGFSVWLRPDLDTGTWLGATDGDGAAQTGVRWHATNNGFSGTSKGGNVLGSGATYLNMSTGAGFLGASTATYAVGTWAHVELINYNGTLRYYLNDVLQDSAVMSAKLNDIRLGAGYWAATGSNGAFDEMKVWTFDHTTDSLTSVEAAMTIPEPATVGLLGLFGMAAVLRRRMKGVK